MPPLRSGLIQSAGFNQSLLQIHERLLTSWLRISLAIAVVPLLLDLVDQWSKQQLAMAMLSIALFGVLWAVALARQLSYNLRCGIVLLTIYLLTLSDLAFSGINLRAYTYLIGFALFTMQFFSFRLRAGLPALVLSALTLLISGMLQLSGLFVPLGRANPALSRSELVASSIFFLLIVGVAQIGISTLLQHIRELWDREREARLLLQREHEQLEARVAERTHALATAHDQALALSQYEAQQRQYLAVLHQTTLELLSQRDVSSVLQTIAERAAAILDSPYALVVLEQSGELVVMARTPNAISPIGTRAVRGKAVQTWRCFESRQPVTTDNYREQADRDQQYDSLEYRAILNVPILNEARCLGVLSFTRLNLGHTYSPTEIEQALSFARLAALVIDNARLHLAAQHELAERERAEGVLKRYADALEQQNAELDAFAHTVAHDLKSPLTSIIGYTELLTTNYDLFEQSEISEFLTTITRMGYKMTRIVNDLLLLASVRAGEEVPREPLDFEQIMLDLDIRLAQAVASSKAVIRWPQRWPAALGYAPWVEEVLANYLTNALKYGGQPPRITVGVEPTDDGQVCFWVDDNGPGLSSEEQAQLFTPFTRLRARRAEGHGLGLSIAQRIVQRLGGRVGVESQLGQGSRFFFTLPAAAPAPDRP